jgi:hypothetical protein
MRKLFTTIMFLVAAVLSAWAQETPTFTILDSDGNEVESGSVVTITEWAMEADPETGELVSAGYLDSGLKLRKNCDEAKALAAVVDLTSIDNGVFCESIAGVTRESSEPVTYETGKSDFFGSEPRPVSLRWIPATADSYGVCEATVRFDVYERTGVFPPFRYEKVEDGPVVTIKFANEHPGELGIDLTERMDLTPKAHYLINGQQVATPRKGLNIVKYADGTTRKIMVK